MTSDLPPRAQALVGLMGALGLALLGANVVVMTREPPGLSLPLAAQSVAFLVAFVVLERLAVTFAWRDHRIRTGLTEIALLLGYITLPPTVVVVLVTTGLTIIHVASRRSAIKGVFNVSHGAIAASGGAATLLALDALAFPLVPAAILATVVYSVLNEFTLASLFGVLEQTPIGRVYRERFVLSNALAIAAGIPVGLSLYGLWGIHPFATLAVVPLAVLIQRSASLQARVDRELAAHRRLVDSSASLIGMTDRHAIAEAIMESCGALLDPSRARFEMGSGPAWERAFDTATAQARAPLVEAVVGRDGSRLAVLSVWPRALKPDYGEDERQLLRLVAGQAAHALESASAMEQLAAQRDVLSRQEKLSALGLMMAGVAHEINNPLTYMKLRLDIGRMETDRMLGRQALAPEVRAYAESMRKSGETFERGIERLVALTHSLKVVARPGDGQRRPTKLNDVVTEVLTVVRAAHKHVTYQVDLAPDLPDIEANAAELHQVVLNLVKNACEALAERPDASIRVATEARPGGVELRVVDNGPGIPPEARQRLFTPFFTTKKTGTGLGLSVTRQIVVAHGGAIEVETAPGGVGTAFRIALPLKAPPREERSAQAAPASA